MAADAKVRRVGAFLRAAAAPILSVVLARAPVADWLSAAFAGNAELQWSLGILANAFTGTLRMTVATTGFFALMLVPVGALVRMIARARVRSGLGDPLAGLRGLSARAVDASLVGIVVAWTALLAMRFHGDDLLALGSAHLLASMLGGAAQLVVMRAGVRALLRPTLGEGAEAPAKARAGITYDAVARTGEARAAIGAVFVLSLAMFAAVATLPISMLMHDPRVFGAVGGYALLVLAAAFGFRNASRAAIGIDGVRVYGTSRTRFFGYRDLDEVRARGVGLELVRAGRVVLTLQLHGEDAARRDEVKGIIAAAIERAAAEKGSSEHSIVAASSPHELVRGAVGAADYRRPAMSREQLWSVVESAAGDPKTRMTAIEALVRTGDASDRERLRVAYEQYAEPSVRVGVRELDARAEELGEEEDTAAPSAKKAIAP